MKKKKVKLETTKGTHLQDVDVETVDLFELQNIILLDHRLARFFHMQFLQYSVVFLSLSDRNINSKLQPRRTKF